MGLGGGAHRFGQQRGRLTQPFLPGHRVRQVAPGQGDGADDAAQHGKGEQAGGQQLEADGKIEEGAHGGLMDEGSPILAARP